MSLEVIILPLIYYIGYEQMMGWQRQDFEKDVESIISDAGELYKENLDLKTQVKNLQKN